LNGLQSYSLAVALHIICLYKETIVEYFVSIMYVYTPLFFTQVLYLPYMAWNTKKDNKIYVTLFDNLLLEFH